MKNEKSLFIELTCLEDRKAIKLSDLWERSLKSFDGRYLTEEFNKLFIYNVEYLRFLGLNYQFEDTDKNAKVVLTSSNYIGCIPIKAHGKYPRFGDLLVTPRFTKLDKYEDLINILDVLDFAIEVETLDSSPLLSGKSFTPPFYLEAAKFLDILQDLVKRPWRKFKVEEVSLNVPQGNVNWPKYALTEYRPESKLAFPVRKNVINEFHPEYGQIRFVYDLCKKEILSFKTPHSVKIRYYSILNTLDTKLYFHKPIRTTNIKVHSYDPSIVKTCKIQSNLILNRDFSLSQAWRLDVNLVFEKFVQYLFKKVANRLGASIHLNQKFNLRGLKQFSWDLFHLEPDIILKNGTLEIVVDAKYKSHLYNRESNSDHLKEDYRRDLHQVLAYASFQESKTKFAILAYPSFEFMLYEKEISCSGSSLIKVYQLGVPFNVNDIESTVSKLLEEVNSME